MTRRRSTLRPDVGKPVTMKDIARAAGVSQSTVSRILSNATAPISISPETRLRVQTTAQQLGYRPNPFARALRGAPSMLLGVIVREITDPFFAVATEALSTEARPLGYNLVLGLAHSRADEAVELAAVLESRQCDAIVVMGDMQHQPQLLDDLRLSQIPVVALWQGSELHGIPAVNVDNAAGVSAATRHLRDLGHERIAFVASFPLGDIRERQAAYMSAVGNDPVPGYVQHVPNTPAGGASAFEALRTVAPRPTAIIASTDVLALGVLHAAHAEGMSVPADLSVVGFDDLPFAAFAVPSLTTVRMPTASMVSAAVELVVGATRGESNGKAGAVVRTFQPELVVRRSTAPRRQGRA